MKKLEKDALERIGNVATTILHYNLKTKGINLSPFNLHRSIGAYTIQSAKRVLYFDALALQLLTKDDDNYLAFWIAHELGHLSSGFPRREEKAHTYAENMLLKNGIAKAEIERIRKKQRQQEEAIGAAVNRLYEELDKIK